MPAGFEKIIGLLKRTGDRCVVVDEQGNPTFVVMPFSQYEDLLDRQLKGPPGGSSLPPVVGGAPQELGSTAHAVVTQPIEPLPAEPMESSDRYYFEPIE